MSGYNSSRDIKGRLTLDITDFKTKINSALSELKKLQTYKMPTINNPNSTNLNSILKQQKYHGFLC